MLVHVFSFPDQIFNKVKKSNANNLVFGQCNEPRDCSWWVEIFSHFQSRFLLELQAFHAFIICCEFQMLLLYHLIKCFFLIYSLNMPVGAAVGFRLDSLLKLTDTRSRNSKMTLMHYLCKVKYFPSLIYHNFQIGGDIVWYTFCACKCKIP